MMDYTIPQYFEQVTSAIDLCLANDLPLPGITLLYSGIDVAGFLAGTEQYARRKTFVPWAEKYLGPFLSRHGISGLDLYSARCGLLHTAQAASELVDRGIAREIWYGFKDDFHINMMTNTPKPAVLIRVEEFVGSFRFGVDQWLMDLQADPALLTKTEKRAQRAFRLGKFFN